MQIGCIFNLGDERSLHYLISFILYLSLTAFLFVSHKCFLCVLHMRFIAILVKKKRKLVKCPHDLWSNSNLNKYGIKSEKGINTYILLFIQLCPKDINA